VSLNQVTEYGGRGLACPLGSKVRWHALNLSMRINIYNMWRKCYHY
jgi:hypothetical protein